MSKLEAQGTAALIPEILAAIASIGPIGIELYLKLEKLFALGPDEQANVTSAIKAGLDADAATIACVETWKQKVGL